MTVVENLAQKLMRLLSYNSIFARSYPKVILELKFDSDVKDILGNYSEEFLAKTSLFILK